MGHFMFAKTHCAYGMQMLNPASTYRFRTPNYISQYI